MRQVFIQKFLEFCNNNHAPLTLQKLLKEKASSLKLEEEHILWFKKYIHRIRDIVRSEPGHQTLYAFKDGGTHTSYSIKKVYGKDSHSSYRDWLTKLEEIGLLCRFDQEDGLENWSKKKVYGVNPEYKAVTKIALDIIHKKYYAPNI